jgi:hypothetical protein
LSGAKPIIFGLERWVSLALNPPYAPCFNRRNRAVELNHLLSLKGIDTKKDRVLVMRHVPTAPELRRTLPWLAAERPEVFNAYQRSQHPRVEKQLTQAAYVASSIGHKAREALFVGLYKVIGSRQISFEEF